eukprot:9495018-Pyramimonas_sp.AAC.1
MRGRLSRLGGVLGTSWAVLERRKLEKARIHKALNKLWGITGFCLSGPSWGPSGGLFSPFWGLLRPHGAEVSNC